MKKIRIFALLLGIWGAHFSTQSMMYRGSSPANIAEDLKIQASSSAPKNFALMPELKRTIQRLKESISDVQYLETIQNVADIVEPEAYKHVGLVRHTLKEVYTETWKCIFASKTPSVSDIANFLDMATFADDSAKKIEDSTRKSLEYIDRNITEVNKQLIHKIIEQITHKQWTQRRQLLANTLVGLTQTTQCPPRGPMQPVRQPQRPPALTTPRSIVQEQKEQPGWFDAVRKWWYGTQ